MKPKKIILLATILIVVFTIPIQNLAKRPFYTQPMNTINFNTESVYQWDDFILVDYTDKIRDMSQKKVKTLYINLEGFNYIGRVNYPSKTLSDYTSKLQGVINIAKSNNLRVEALLGSSDWSLKENQYHVFDVLDFIINYNANTIGNKILGLHLNIEFYNYVNYNLAPEELTIEYLNFIENIDNQVAIYRRDSLFNFRLGQSISFQLMNSLVFPRVLYNNKTQFILEHLNSILGNSSYNYISVMAYRSFALGSNSIVDLMTPILNYITLTKSNMMINNTVEVANINDNHVSFFSSSLNRFYGEMNLVQKSLSIYPRYNGVVINDFNSYLTKI